MKGAKLDLFGVAWEIKDAEFVNDTEREPVGGGDVRHFLTGRQIHVDMVSTECDVTFSFHLRQHSPQQTNGFEAVRSAIMEAVHEAEGE